MLNAMSQGNDGSMATIHACSSRGVFTKLAAYAAQAPERLSLEATNLLVAAAVHFVVHLAWSTAGVRVDLLDPGGRRRRRPRRSSPTRSTRPARTAAPSRGARLRADTLDDLAAAGFEPALADRGQW